MSTDKDRKKFREALVEKQIAAFALFGSEKSPYSVAEILKVPRSTVRRWHKDWKIATYEGEIRTLKAEASSDRARAEQFDYLAAATRRVRTRDRLIVLLAWVAGGALGGGIVAMVHDIWPWVVH